MKNIFTNIRLRTLLRKKRFTAGTIKTELGTVQYIDATSAYHQYKSIVGSNIYDISALTPEPQRIIDCGANIGMATLYFSTKYPSAKIIAFEPQPDAFAALEKNLAGKTNVSLINKAVWSSDGSLTFNSASSDAGSLSVVSEASRPITVETVSLSSYLNDPVDLLKIDIEGAEYEVLRSIKDKLRNVKNIFIECHISNLDGRDLKEVLDILSSNGFSYYLSPESVPGAPFKNMRRKKSGNFYYQINVFASRL